MMELIRDCFGFIKDGNKLVLAPLVFLLLLLGFLFVASQGSVVAPFIYTLF